MENIIEKAQPLFDLIEPYLPLIASVSVVIILASMVLIPLLVVKMPADYFMYRKRQRHWTMPRIAIYILRNILALVLLVAGLLMLVLPGQGLLTLIIAIVVSDFPGKFPIERWLLRQRGVFSSMNWIRRRYQKPELEIPERNRQPREI